MSRRDAAQYTLGEEIVNATTHWIGVLLGIISLIYFIYFGIKSGTAIQIASFVIYGITFILMYLCSAIYHSVPAIKQRAKSILRVFDHSSIFIFIAGSYVPIALLSFKGALRVSTLVIVWAVAVVGIVFKILNYGKFNKTKRVSLLLYLSLGWLSVFLLKFIYDATNLKFILFLGLGGLFYTIGTYFYVNKKIPYNHGIWHLFVLAGSLAHLTGNIQFYLLGS